MALLFLFPKAVRAMNYLLVPVLKITGFVFMMILFTTDPLKIKVKRSLSALMNSKISTNMKIRFVNVNFIIFGSHTHCLLLFVQSKRHMLPIILTDYDVPFTNLAICHFKK